MVPPPEPEKNADESGLRIFIPSDDHEYGLGYLSRWFATQAHKHPNVVLDHAEACDNGILFDFVNPSFL
jgi:hypothetical protein